MAAFRDISKRVAIADVQRQFDTTIRAITEYVTALPSRKMKALIRVGFIIQAEAQRRCPVDSGNLRGTAFVVWSERPDMGFVHPSKALPSKDRVKWDEGAAQMKAAVASRLQEQPFVVLVGFAAYYAMYVHEDLMGVVPRAGGVGEHHFLMNAVVEKRFTIFRLLSEG